MSTPAPLQSRPGGRSARIRAAVHRAVEELLAEGPADALTIPVVAARAGTHPTTVYRRWGSIGELLAAVAASRFSGAVVVPDTGSARGDLEQWTVDVATDLADPEALALLRAAVAAGAQSASDCTADRRAQLSAIIARGTERGEAVPDVDRAVDGLLGPLYYRAVFLGVPVAHDWARGLVSDLLA